MGVLGLLREALRAGPDRAERFEQEYPLSLPGRLEAWERRLGVPRERLLRLAGAPPAFAADPAVAQQPWESLVAQQSAVHRDQLAEAEQALAGYLSQFDYDWATAARHLRAHRARTERGCEDRDDVLLSLLAEAREGEAFDLLTEFLGHRGA